MKTSIWRWRRTSPSASARREVGCIPGRSRNDQVALDNRLVARRFARELYGRVLEVREALLARAEGEFGVVMPGYTHMQKAQPVLFSHHMLAYFWMFTRDAKRLRDAYDAADVCPLGSAALAGTTYPLDRSMTAEALGFAGVTPNSLDAVSDRDFFCDLVYACAMTSMHLSRLCEELVYWSSDEFRFITMDDTLLHRVVDHAPEEEPRLCRAHARQDGPGVRRPRVAAHHAQGFAAGLQQGHPRKTRSRSSTRWIPWRTPCTCAPAWFRPCT